jgi:hypothetical protein
MGDEQLLYINSLLKGNKMTADVIPYTSKW